MLRRAQAVLLRSNHLFHERREVLLEGPVDLALRVPQRRKGNSQQFLSQFHHTLLQVIRSNHFVNEPHGETFMSIETVTEQAEVLGTAGTNEPGQTHWPQSGNHAFFDSGNTEHGIGRGNQQIAGHCNLQATTQAIALDSSDGDGFKIGQCSHAILPGGEPFAGKRSLSQLLDIKTTAEGAAFTADDDDPRPCALRQVIGGLDKVLHPGPVGGIEGLWTIES